MASSMSVTVPGSVVLVVVDVLVLLDEVVLLLVVEDVVLVVDVVLLVDDEVEVVTLVDVVEVAPGSDVLVVVDVLVLVLLVVDVELVDVLVVVVVAAAGSRLPAIAGGDCPESCVPSLKKIVLTAPGVHPGCVSARISRRFVNAPGSPSESSDSTLANASWLFVSPATSRRMRMAHPYAFQPSPPPELWWQSWQTAPVPDTTLSSDCEPE
jgi:hypothetical protein